MEITFASTKLKKLCIDSKKAAALGPLRARKLRTRLDDIRAAANLEVLKTLPGRLHMLIGDRNEQFSLDLDHPYRLLFVCADDPEPREEDGGLDWKRITAITIIAIEDTHE